jgi:hypothetical protein
MAISGYQRLSIAINGYLRFFFGYHYQEDGSPTTNPFSASLIRRLSLAGTGYQWRSLAITGDRWLFLAVNGYLRYFIGHHYREDGLCSKYAPAVIDTCILALGRQEGPKHVK